MCDEFDQSGVFNNFVQVEYFILFHTETGWTSETVGLLCSTLAEPWASPQNQTEPTRIIVDIPEKEQSIQTPTHMWVLTCTHLHTLNKTNCSRWMIMCNTSYSVYTCSLHRCTENPIRSEHKCPLHPSVVLPGSWWTHAGPNLNQHFIWS